MEEQRQHRGASDSHEGSRSSPPPSTVSLLRAVCDTANDAIFVKDEAGRYLYVNPACARLFGVESPEIVGTTDDRWVGPERGAQLRDHDRLAAKRGVFTRDEALELGGESYVFSTTKVPFRDETGRIVGIVGIARDVQVARREAEVVRAERDMFATMAAVVPGAFVSWRVEPSGEIRIPYATASIAELFGAPPEAIAAAPETHFWGRMEPGDRARAEQAIRGAAADLRAVRLEVLLAHPERGELWVEIAAGPLRDRGGATALHGFVLDVTPRKRAERDLAEERDRIAGIAASSPGALCAFRSAPDGSTSFPYFSESLTRIYGIPAEEIRRDAASVFSRVHPDDVVRVNESIALSARTMEAWRCEYRFAHPTRGELWIEGQSQPIRAPDGGTVWNGVVTEITERRRSAARHERLIELMPDALFVHTNGRIELCNPAFVRLLRAASAEQLIGSSAIDFIAPEDQPRVLERLAAMLATGAPAPAADVNIVTLEGARRRVRVVATPVDTGSSPSILVIMHDITERARAEHLLASVLESVSDAVLTIDADSTIQAVNPAVSRLFGYSPAELLGADITLLMPEHHARAHARYMARHRRSGTSSVGA